MSSQGTSEVLNIPIEPSACCCPRPGETVIRRRRTPPLPAWLALLGLLAAGRVSAAPQTLKLGWASVDITPDQPVQLFGQYDERISTGVHDPLSATAMAVESGSGDVQAIMVSIDLLEGGYKLQKDLRALLATRLPGFNLTNLIINATHDHCAPYPFTPPDRSAPAGMMTGDEWRTNMLLPRLADVVVQAWSNRATAAVSFQKGAVAVGFCRICTYQNGTAQMYGNPLVDRGFKEMESGNDHSMGLLYCFDAGGTLKGVVINVANPPQEVQDDTEITASVWGEVRNQLASAYPGILVLPQCSAAGCQCPWDLEAGDSIEDDYDRMRAHATLIANLVLTNFAAAYAGRQSSLVLDHQVRSYTVPQKPVYGGTYPWELHVLKLGNTVFANCPFELYLDYGFQIKALSMADNTMLVQLSGDADDLHLTQYQNPELYLGYHVGYLPTARAVAGGAYGAQDENGGVGPEGGAQVVTQTVGLINAMVDGSTTTQVDETNASFLYDGAGWASYREPGLYNLNAEATAEEEDYVQFTFTGTSIRWYDTSASDRGQAEVYLDGNFQTIVDGYSPITLYQHELYRATGLGSGSHTLKIVNHGDKNDDSSDYIIGVDYFVVGTGGSGGTVSAPTFSPAAGTYNTSLSVTIRTPTSGASIRYTVNGNTPTSTSGKVYSSPVSITTGTTLKAIAYKSGMSDSSVTSGDYVLVAGTPAFTPPAGSYTNAQSVAISTVTSGASIRYTTNGAVPTSSSGKAYSGPVPISTNTTLMAIAYKNGFSDSSVASGDYSILTAVPVFNPPPATFPTAQSVTITTPTGGASIRYTTNGSTPTSSSGTVYTGAVPISVNTTLKAIAYKSGLTDSAVASGAYAIQVAAPLVDPPAGNYASPVLVALSTPTVGASIRYTIDGTAPSATVGTLYAGPVPISANTIVKAVAFKSGMSNSPVASALYSIQAAPPTFNPPAGTFSNAQWVLISTSTAGAAIRYTTDGSTPSSTNGTLYTNAFSVDANWTVQAIAYKAGMNDSPITSATYSIQAAAPLFAPPAGTYSNAQSVTINTSTAGAFIRYTTDGTTPSGTNGTLYTAAVAIDENTTLRAIACRADLTDSACVGGNYFVQTAAPSFTPQAGYYPGRQTVAIGTPTPGASIRFTADGTTPTASLGTLYSDTIPVATNTTLKAIAYKAGLSDSPVSSGDFLILPSLTAALSGGTLRIAWTPPGGTLQVATQVTATGAAWSDVGSANPANLALTSQSNQFYRVRLP